MGSWFSRMDSRILLTPKMIYFAVASVYYAFYIFRVRFCEDYYGFQTDKAGDIAAIMSLSGFLTIPLWSWLADRTQRHCLILALLGILASVFFEALLFKFPTTDQNYYYSLFIFALFGSVLGGLLPLADYQILKLLSDKFAVSRTLYGRQRMMGTVSYSLISWLMGLLLDLYGAMVFFYIFPLFSAILAILLFFFAYPDRPHKHQSNLQISREEAGDEGKAEDHKKSSQSAIDQSAPSIRAFFTNVSFVIFLLTVFVTGCGRQVLQVYLPLFLAKSLQMTSQQAGLAVVFSSIFSVTFMFIGAHILRIFGTSIMLFLGMLTMALRIGLYLVVPQRSSSAWIVYAIELLNGVAFSFTHLAGVKVAADFAPKGLEASAQAIYTSAYMQLPAVIVSFIGGRVYKTFGAERLFGGSCLFLIIGTILLALKSCIQYLSKNRSNL